VKAKLEIIASDTFIIPWSDSVRIGGPIKMTVEEDQPEKDAIDKYIKEEPEDNLKNLLSLDEEDIKDKVKDKKVKEREESFSIFLNTPIEELL